VNLKGYKDSTVDLNEEELENTDDQNEEEVQKRYAVLIYGLRQAESLVLKFGTTTAFWSACRLLRGRPSPFRRLKSLTLRHKEDDMDMLTADQQVLISYFFGSSGRRIDYGHRVTKVGPSV
ncbi:unnamed protein product, partial [Linum tenue]